MRGVSAAVVVALVLGGCTEERPQTEAGQDVEFEQDLEATSTTGVIRGVVVDRAIVPVANATVNVQNTEHTMVTGASGQFGFQDLAPGTYFLVVSKPGYNATQTSVNVEAGVDKPRAISVMLTAAPGTEPAVVPSQYNGYLACGAAIIATSVGCTTTGIIADLTESQSVFLHRFEADTVQWTQGELVWDHNQAAGGMLIFEITARSNTPHGYRTTGESPALAYWDTAKLEENPNDALTEGVTYRFFGGPHPLCTGVFFGCGLTIDQEAVAYVHDFYNMVPDEGWRFTADGDHPIPT